MNLATARTRVIVALAAVALLACAPAAEAAGKKKKRFFEAPSSIEIESYARAVGQLQPFTFKGGVDSPRPSCRYNRTVQLHLGDAFGAERVYETVSVFDTTETEGFWSVSTDPVGPGSYSVFAEVLKRKSKKGLCKADRTPTQPVGAI